jgi:o-succinylbenzoate---CoA ligase
VADLAATAFYYEPSRWSMDWESRDTTVAANPVWVGRDRPAFEAALAALPSLRGHVWVATSGSSSAVPGHVRWVALSKEAFLASARAVNAHLEATPRDVWAHALPVFHVGGLGILARAWASGASVEPAVAGRWEAWRFSARLHETHATLTALVPSQVHDLVNAGLRPPRSLRAVVVGGARLDPELCADARRLGWPCLPSYGMTETCSQVATASLASALSVDCGSTLPVLAHAEIRADEEHRLRIRAASLLTAYAEMTDAGMRSWDPRQDGWLITDDLGRVEAGSVEVLGRVTDSVKVLGETVSLSRVEDVARQWARSDPGTTADVDLAVVALPHPRLGHELVVVLAPIGGGPGAGRLGLASLLPSLLSFTRERLLPYEQPARLVAVEQIPRTALGKIQRQLLAQQVSLQPRTDG